MSPEMILIYWAGFVCSISFMEAWLKFRVPGVTLPIGLSIGSKVFKTLNRTEWFFFLLLTGILLFVGEPVRERIIAGFFLLAFLLLLQTFLFLPRLDRRAQKIIKGEPVKPSGWHLSYVIAELLKVMTLISLGFSI